MSAGWRGRMSLCALCATPIDGDPECMVLVCKNGHDDSVHDKCYKNRYSNETYKKAQHGESTKYGRGPAKERCLHDGCSSFVKIKAATKARSPCPRHAPMRPRNSEVLRDVGGPTRLRSHRSRPLIFPPHPCRWTTCPRSQSRAEAVAERRLVAAAPAPAAGEERTSASTRRRRSSA